MSPAFEEFVKHFCIAAMWTQDENPKSGEWQQHDCWKIENIVPAEMEKIREHCLGFWTMERGKFVQSFLENNPEKSGHDFLLTSQRHGTGFWDRGLSFVGKILTEQAHTFSSDEIFYIGEDGKLYTNI